VTPCYTWAISEHFRDKGLIYKALHEFICSAVLPTIGRGTKMHSRLGYQGHYLRLLTTLVMYVDQKTVINRRACTMAV